MKKTVYIAFIIGLIFLFSLVAQAASLPAPSYVNAFVYGSGNIRVSWDNTVPGATRYTIQRKTDSGNFTTVTTVPSNVNTWNDTGISNGHIYTYRVFATNASLSGETAESLPVEYLYPSGLSTKSLSDTQIELTWSYPSWNNIHENNYQTVIERRTEGSSTWQTVATVPGTQNTYTDTGLSEGLRYYYRIRTLTATSAMYLYYPNNTSGHMATTMLKAPSNLSARIISTHAVELTWEDNSEKETGYLVERRKGYGSFVTLKTLGENEKSYIDNTAVNGEQYTYRVTPVRSSFVGTPSSEVTVPFLFPVSVQIKETFSNQITLTWQYPGSGSVSPASSVVLIERRKSGNLFWEQIHTSYSGETEYTDSGLEPGTRYHYRIRTRHDGGFTTDYLPSAAGISGYTKLMLDTYFYGYALSQTEIRLEWDGKAIGDHTVILEKLYPDGTYETLATMSHTGYYIDRVSAGSVHTYRMKVRSSTAESEYIPDIVVTAEPLPQIHNPVIRAILPERIFLTWEYDKALESGFEVWRKIGASDTWKLVGTTGRNQPMFSDEDIVEGETYTYRIRAVKSNTIFSPFVQTPPVHVSFVRSDADLVIGRDTNGMLYLGWDDFSDMEERYIVEYKTSVNDTWHVLDNLPENVTMYRFIPREGMDYTLRVRAYNESPVFERISAERFFTTRIPATPMLMVPSVVGPSRVVVTWTDLSENEDEFVVYRRDGSSGFTALGTVNADQTVFNDISVVPGRSYTYMVKAKNAAGESFASAEIVVQTPSAVSFTDLGSHPWAKEAVETLASMGIVNGVGNGLYRPAGNVTRAEFIKLLVAAFSFPESTVGSFKDVMPGDWHHRWIMTAYRNGIVEPDESGLFHPNAPITRQDIVYYSARAMKATGLSLEQPPLYLLYRFRDFDQVAGYAQSAFAFMTYNGVINGIGENKLGPLYPATRAEAAAIIHRMLQLVEKQTGNRMIPKP